MDEIQQWIKAESVGHWFFIAFPVCLLALFIWFKGRRTRFLVPSLIITLAIVNPWFYRKWEDLGLYAYWRVLWIIPVIPVVAGVAPSLAERTSKTALKGLIAVLGVAGIALCGTYLYTSGRGSFDEAANPAKLPAAAVEVADRLLELNDRPRVIAEGRICVYIRQYTGEIDLLYGRDIDGYILRAGATARNAYNAIKTEDWETVRQVMLDEGYDYLVVSGEPGEGFEKVDTIAGYGIYSAQGTPTVVRERSDLGQVLSSTTVDGTGQPIDGANGFATTTYEYDDYGNVVREFHTDANGLGAADSNGIAGYERKYDGVGHMIMERQIDATGNPIVNASGYAEMRRTYRGGNIIRESYYDADGAPVNRADTLYATVEMEFDGLRNCVDTRYYDADHSPVNSNLGYARQTRQYERKNPIVEAYFGPDGEPVTVSGGYASIRRHYDAKGHMTSRSYLDAYGNPVNCVDGYATVQREYDADGNVALERFLDAAGTPVVTPSGYAEVRRVYDRKALVREAYFGSNGKPLARVAGYAAIEQTWDGDNLLSRTYLDADGNPMQRSDGYAQAIWIQNEQGTWAVDLLDLSGNEVSLAGINLARDIHYGLDGWSEWMTPDPYKNNRCFNIGTINLGSKAEGDIYSCKVEIEFESVAATQERPFRFFTQGAQDGKWGKDNVWNRALINLTEAPMDGIYDFTSTVEVSADMVGVSTFNIGFRCDYWRSGSFRIRNVVIEKGESADRWAPGL